MICRMTLSLGILAMVAGSAIAQEPPAPTDEHAVLKKDVGTWEADITMHMGPGAEEKSTGVEVNSMLGEFWVTSQFKADFFGQPFEGRCVMGYDPAAKKYVGFWYDSMSPWGMHMEGSYDAASHTFTWKTHGRDMMGNEQKGQIVYHWIDENTRTFEMAHTMPGSAEMMKALSITYKRKKD